MAHLASHFCDWFWNPKFWLPPNVTWESFEEPQILNGTVTGPSNYAKPVSELLYPIPMALVMMLFRIMLEKGIFKPMGIMMGLTGMRRPMPVKNQTLEKAYRSSEKHTRNEVEKLSIETGMTYLQVERWFRKRKLATIPSKLEKFCEEGYSFIVYTILLVYGVTCVLDKSWLWTVRYCWDDYPFHAVENSIWWYYMTELALYWSFTFMQLFDMERKDFVEMFIHHIVTISFLNFFWINHLYRFGVLGLILNNASHPILPLAKLFRYTNYMVCCDIIFFIFTVAWVVTRGYFLQVLIANLVTSSIPLFPAYGISLALLAALQLLNIIWTFFIFKALYKAMTNVDVKGDKYDSDEEDEKSENKTQEYKNE